MILRSPSHVSRYFWKRRQFTPQTSVHTYITFSGTKNAGFRNRSPERSFSKTLALIFFLVWKDENGGYFRIRRCHTSYSVWQEWDAIEATQKIISFFQNIRIRVSETCVVRHHYSHTRITRMTKVIHEPLRSHDWAISRPVNSLLSRTMVHESIALTSDFPRNFTWNGRFKAFNVP